MDRPQAEPGGLGVLATILSGARRASPSAPYTQPYPSWQLVILNGVLTAAAGVAAAVVRLPGRKILFIQAVPAALAIVAF